MDALPEAIYISSVSPYELAMAEEFVIAQYNLSPNEMKAWLLLVTSMQASDDSGGTAYEFDAIGFADRLGIDARKARGRMVADLFVRISSQYIDIRSRADCNGDQDILHINFISSVLYNKSSHILRVDIPTQMLPFIYALRHGTYIAFDINTILVLNTVASMRIFFLLKNLERKGIRHISIDEFRKTVNIAPGSDYRTFKRDVIKKSVAEIHKHTEYKDFYIEDDGGKGRKAFTLFFGFSKDQPDEDDIKMSPIAPALYQQLSKKFSKRVLAIMGMAVERGFDPRYIRNQFDAFDDDRICANISLVIERIRRDNLTGKPKSPDEYGRYFIPAVINDWAGMGSQREKLLQSADKRIANYELRKRMAQSSDIDAARQQAEACQAASKKYVDSMTVQELAAFIRKNSKSLSALSGKKGFDREKAMGRKKSCREYRILCQFVAGKILCGDIVQKK